MKEFGWKVRVICPKCRKRKWHYPRGETLKGKLRTQCKKCKKRFLVKSNMARR